MLRISAVASLLALLVACFPSAHSQTAKTLEGGESVVTLGLPMGLAAPKVVEEEPEDTNTWQLVWPTTADIGFSAGATDWLTVGARVKLGFLVGAEADVRLRFLSAGPLHLAVGGDLGGMTSWLGGGNRLGWTHGRLLWALDLSDEISLVGSGNLGAWQPFGDASFNRGFSLGFYSPDLEFEGSRGHGTFLFHTDWGGDEPRPMFRLSMGYEIPL